MKSKETPELDEQRTKLSLIKLKNLKFMHKFRQELKKLAENVEKELKAKETQNEHMHRIHNRANQNQVPRQGLDRPRVLQWRVHIPCKQPEPNPRS